MRYIRTLIVGWMSPMQKQSSQGTYIPCLGHSGHGVNSWRWRRDRPKRRDKVSSSSVVRHSSRTSLWETVTGVHLFTLCKFHVRTWQACNGCWNHSHYLTSRSAVDPWVCDILSANPIYAPVLIPMPHKVHGASRGGGAPIRACMNAPSQAGSFRVVTMILAMSDRLRRN